MKYFSTILTILGLYFFVYACAEKPCTDDGCPGFNELTIPEPLEDIRGEIKLYHELVVPVIQTETKDQFVYSLNECINYLYANEISIENRVPKELIVAQAAIETGWGQSRFANEANNLFGIRTFDKSDNWMLPATKKDWTGWGVKVYPSKCASVRDYVRIINEVWAYEELRNARAENPNISAEELSLHLYRFSTNPKYTKLVINIIKTKLVFLRQELELMVILKIILN